MVRYLVDWEFHGGYVVLTLGGRDRYDELHPSVQAERVVAKALSDVIHRRSEKWITWLS